MTEGGAQPASPKEKTAAGITGGALGTLVVAVAEALPIRSSLQNVLIYAAPGAAVAAAALWFWVQHRVLGWFQERDVKKALKDTRETLEAAIRNPDTSEEHRERLRRKLEALEDADVNRQFRRVQAHIVLEGDAPEAGLPAP